MLLARLIFTFINDPFLISEDADAPFSDILQTKGTNGVIQIPRANLPMHLFLTFYRQRELTALFRYHVPTRQ